jgi:BirA family biotin operon repressor/biotin-[acetyl-CoA-carboxylase] ligase
MATRTFGKTIHCLDQIDSTNLCARKNAEEGAAEGDIVFAEEQTQGRGRLGRNWFSPRGLNLYFSLVLRPKFPASRAAQITMMAAVAMAEALEFVLPGPPEIKWPNDILFRSKKLAGILTESSCQGPSIRFVVLGIGLNVNVPHDSLPEPLRDRATSLYELTGIEHDRAQVARLLIQALERCYKDLTEIGFAPLAARWERYFNLKGKTVQVSMQDQMARGTALGIDADGALIIRDADGTAQRIVSGDVSPVF